jgi:hypothetical protein
MVFLTIRYCDLISRVQQRGEQGQRICFPAPQGIPRLRIFVEDKTVKGGVVFSFVFVYDNYRK